MHWVTKKHNALYYSSVVAISPPSLKHVLKYDQPNGRLACCQQTDLGSQMSYPSAWCVPLSFASPGNTLHVWEKEAQDSFCSGFSFRRPLSSYADSSTNHFVSTRAFFRPPRPLALAQTPSPGLRTMFITWSESWQEWAQAASSQTRRHCHAWLASSHQGQLNMESAGSFWTGSSSLALLWWDVLHCFPVVRMWHIPFLLLFSPPGAARSHGHRHLDNFDSTRQRSKQRPEQPRQNWS